MPSRFCPAAASPCSGGMQHGWGCSGHARPNSSNCQPAQPNVDAGHRQICRPIALHSAKLHAARCAWQGRARQPTAARDFSRVHVPICNQPKMVRGKTKEKKLAKISWRGAAGQPGQHTWQPHAGFQRKFGKPAVGNLRRGPTWLRLPPGGPTYDRSDGPVVGWGRSSPRPRPAEALPPQTQLARLATAACFTSL